MTFTTGDGRRELIVLTKNGRRTFTKRMRQLTTPDDDVEVDRKVLTGWDRLGKPDVDRQTTIRSDSIRLEYREADGSVDEEFAIRLLSYPRSGKQQRRRERLLLKEGLDELVEASRALTGKAFAEACREGFVDVPGFSFSHSHRTWAHKQLARAVNRGIPKEAFTSLTLLVSAIPSVHKSPPFSDGARISEIIQSARTRIARTLRRAGVKVAYINGGVEIAEHRMYRAHERVREFVSAYRREHWPASLVEAKCEYVYVIHMHVGLFAHGANGWLSRQALRPHFDAEFVLPYESWLALRPRHPAERNAGRVAGYLRKAPKDYSDALILEDVHLRMMVSPRDLWIEGFWCFGEAKETFASCNLLGRALTRRREIEKLELTGAAVGFDIAPMEWSGDLLTADELRERQHRFKWSATAGAHWRRPPVFVSLIRDFAEGAFSLLYCALRKAARLGGSWPSSFRGLF